MLLQKWSLFYPIQLDTFDQKVFEQLSTEPLENVFNLNLKEVINNSKPVEFLASRYHQRPDRVAWDYHRSLATTNLIMLVNNCFSFLLFTRDNIGDQILVPDKNYLEKLLEKGL